MPVPLLRGAHLASGQELPDPYPALANSRFQVHFYPGQFCMLAGSPGAGKTMLALDMAIKMGVPTLYISADSDDITMRIRAASMITGHDQRDVRKVAKAGLFADIYGPALEGLNIRFVFDPSEPSMIDIGHALEAYVEVNGRYPQLIIVDNICNVDVGTDNEWAGIKMAAKDFHYLSRKTKACVLVLHHTSEQDPRWISQAPPRSAIQGKVSQLQSLIITVASEGNEMFLAVVKNRFGDRDPGAVSPIRFIVDFGRGQIWSEPMMQRGTGE